MDFPEIPSGWRQAVEVPPFVPLCDGRTRRAAKGAS